MIEQILDLHIHSKYSRACSKDLTLPKIGAACEKIGINIAATGDFTHPAWFKHMQESLVEYHQGIYKLREGSCATKFIIGTELSSIRKHKDKVRRIHLLVFAPDLAAAEKFNKKLENDGFNLKSDGRPILGLTSKEILQLALEIDPRMMVIPAHAWTPWFGIFGSKGGYDSLEECFEELTPHVRAIETGLSSDPLMNWHWSALDNITLISNSDAHSLGKLGREANVMQFNSAQEISYAEIMRIIQSGDKEKFKYTIEFYPEEGKYHFDGHAACKFSCAPEETDKLGGICPVCKKTLIVGVMNRVHELADRSGKEAKKVQKVPYKSLVPLAEIIGDTLGMGVSSKAVKKEYDNLLRNFSSEFQILIHEDLQKIKEKSSKEIASAIDRVRKGNIYIEPGYDGIFGVVKVFSKKERHSGKEQSLLDVV